MVAAHEAIGVGIDRFRGPGRPPLDHDGDAARQAGGVVAERDGLADEGGVDLEDDAVETDGAVGLDLALFLEEEEGREVLRRERDVAGGGGPALAGRRVLQAPVRRVEILVFDPGREPLIQRVQGAGVVVQERGEELEADRPKPALQLALSLGRKRSSVNEGHAELGADEREVPRPIGRAVVDVEALRDPAAQNRAFEDRQEGRDGFAAREGRVRNHARGIVEQRDEVRLVPASILRVEHGGPVHDVAHPEFIGGLVAEATPVFAGGGLRRTRHQAVPLEQAVHGGERERHVRRHALLLSRGRHDQRDAIGRVLLFERAQLIGDGLRQGPRVALIGAGTGLEAVEAGAAIGVQPIP